jgi:hypothetical protein
MATKAQIVWNKIALLMICDEAHRVNKSAVTNVVIQKSVFLTELNGRSKDLKAAYYRFFRYKHGPFSTSLSWDIAEFEKGDFIDSESGELLDRARYLLDYVLPEIEPNEVFKTVRDVIIRTAEQWKAYRGWEIVSKVYELKVPVDSLNGQQMRVSDIPMKTDILIPERSEARELQPLPEDLLDDIYSELNIRSDHLDPSSEELRVAGATSLETALARS